MVFAALIAVFYSSFLSHWSGLQGAFDAYVPWVEYGVTGRNQGKHVGYFLGVMASTEGLLRWIALPAALLAVVRRHRFGLALAGWAGSALLIYSLIPYKTPWCVLEIDLPVFLLIGWAAGEAWRHARGTDRPGAIRALALALPFACLLPVPGLLARSLEDNREHYDDFRRPYVYYQTYRQFYEILQDMFGVAEVDPRGDGGGPRVVNVGLEFPLSWYTLTRGWVDARTQYLEQMPTRKQLEQAELIIADDQREDGIDRLLADVPGAWQKQRYFHRPGIFAFVWYRRELWDAYLAAGGRESSPWPRPPVAELRPSGASR